MNGFRNFLIGALCLAMFALVAVGGILALGNQPSSRRASPVPQGTPAPSSGLKKAPTFTLRDLEGKPVRLEDYAGKVILLDFWATWCPPCREEVPHFIELSRQYREKGFVIVGVNVGDSEEAVRRFVQGTAINSPILFANDTILQAYPGIYFLPTSFLIGRNGTLREKLIGYKGKKNLEEKIIPLLEEPVTEAP